MKIHVLTDNGIFAITIWRGKVNEVFVAASCWGEWYDVQVVCGMAIMRSSCYDMERVA